jgi:hypothetical protein
MYSSVRESVYFALDHLPNIYHLSSRLQNAAEKSKTAKQNSQKHEVFQKTVWIWNDISNRWIFSRLLLEIGIVVT